MSLKAWIWIGLFVGSAIGGYAPVLFGADVFSLWAIFGNAIGGLLGIWVGWRLGSSYSL